MSKLVHTIGVAAAMLLATSAAAAAQDAPLPPYVYYIVPCDSPGAIPAAPAAQDPAVAAGPVACVAPVATNYGATRLYRRSPYYGNSWPYYGSFGVAYVGGHHRMSHFGGGGHRGGHGGHGGHHGGGHRGGH